MIWLGRRFKAETGGFEVYDYRKLPLNIAGYRNLWGTNGV